MVLMLDDAAQKKKRKKYGWKGMFFGVLIWCRRDNKNGWGPVGGVEHVRGR